MNIFVNSNCSHGEPIDSARHPVGLLYHTENDHCMPMTRFDPESSIAATYFRYENGLYSRILKKIDRIPTEDYLGLILTFLKQSLEFSFHNSIFYSLKDLSYKFLYFILECKVSHAMLRVQLKTHK